MGDCRLFKHLAFSFLHKQRKSTMKMLCFVLRDLSRVRSVLGLRLCGAFPVLFRVMISRFRLSVSLPASVLSFSPCLVLSVRFHIALFFFLNVSSNFMVCLAV